MKKAGLILIVLLSQFGVTLGLGSVAAYGSTHDYAPPGLVIWGNDLSGLNREEVSVLLDNKLPNSIKYQGKVYPLKLDRTEADINAYLNQLFPASSGNCFSDILRSLTQKPLMNPELGLDQNDIIAQLKTISDRINQPMIPSTISFSNEKLVRESGKEGQTMDIDATWKRLSNEHSQKQVDAVVKNIPVQPDLTQLAKVGNVLGDYTTQFNPWEVSRTTNVRLAANALNNHLIAPGEVFSFNDVVGVRSETAGYLPAYLFENNKVVVGDGGGICQDSSTLFQAVSQARLKVEERHIHSLPVSYVPSGDDATVFYGSLDFRFRNDTNNYLLISAVTGEDWIRIRLFGVADANHPILTKPGIYPAHNSSYS